MQWLLAVTARRGLDLSNVAVNRDDGRGSKTVESMWRFPIEILSKFLLLIINNNISINYLSLNFHFYILILINIVPLRAGYGFPSLNDDHSEGTYISGSVIILFCFFIFVFLINIYIYNYYLVRELYFCKLAVGTKRKNTK